MKTDKKRAKRGNVLTYFDNLKPGDCFYTDLPNNFITVYSVRYGVKLKTEKIICINPKSLKTEKITKVTIL